MKRIWFGAALLVLLLALGLWLSTRMERTHLAQSEKISRAATLAMQGDWDGAGQLIRDTREEWDKKQPLFSSLSDHEPIDKGDCLFAQLEIYAKARDSVSFSSTCAYLSQHLESMGEGHGLTLANFF